MQSLGEKRALSKDFNLTSNEVLTDSWETVAKETVINCFKKDGINSDVQQAAIANSDDPFKDHEENLFELKLADPSMVSEDVTAESISLYDDIIAFISEIAESGITGELCLSQQTEV